MGTKNEPGVYDCYAKAEPDEPMYVLLARDPLAAHLIHLWVFLRAHDWVSMFHELAGLMAIALSEPRKADDDPKLIEAQQRAVKMAAWRLGRASG